MDTLNQHVERVLQDIASVERISSTHYKIITKTGHTVELKLVVHPNFLVVHFELIFNERQWWSESIETRTNRKLWQTVVQSWLDAENIKYLQHTEKAKSYFKD